MILQGRLFNDYYVNVHEDAVSTGGSWQWSNGQPVAAEPKSLCYFYDRLVEHTKPHYLDIGANTGSFTQLTAIVPDSYCHAFEPNPLIMKRLQCNVHLTGLTDRVMLHNEALWSETAILPFRVPYGENTGKARLIHEIGDLFEGQYEIEVMAVPLDNLVAGIGRVDLMKLDVEGAELMVLQGAEQTIRKNWPGIMVEWYPRHCEPYGYHPEKIDNFLGRMGYVKEQVSIYDVFYSRA